MAACALGFAAIGRERFDTHWHIGTFVTFGGLAAVGLSGEAWRLCRAISTSSSSTVVTTYRLAIARNVTLALLLAAGCATLLVPWSDGYPVQWSGNAWQADFDFLWWLSAIAVLGMSSPRRPLDVKTESPWFNAGSVRFISASTSAVGWPAGLLLAIVLTETDDAALGPSRSHRQRPARKCRARSTHTLHSPRWTSLTRERLCGCWRWREV